MKNSFGIDKVGLHIPLDQVDVSKCSRLTETYTLTPDVESGDIAESLQRRYNHPDNLFLFDINKLGARVLFNPSKPYHDYELCGSSKDLVERTNRVFDELSSIGISINREATEIMRLDITKNIQLSQPLIHYTDALALAKFPRATRQHLYPGGFLSGNNTRALIVYDKTEEANLSEYGIVRGEMQLRRKKTMKRIGFQYWDSQLIERSRNLFKSEMQKTFQMSASDIPSQLAISFDEFSQLWSNLKALHPRNTLQYFDNALSAYTIIERIGIPEHLNFCRARGMENKNVERRRKELLSRAQQLHLAGITNTQTKGSIAVALLSEISQKLIAA